MCIPNLFLTGLYLKTTYKSSNMKKITLIFFIIITVSSVFAQKDNNALDFDGSNDYVQTTFNGILGSANRTFEAWIYLADTPTSNNCILDYGSNFVGRRNTFFVNANLAIGFVSGGTNTNITSASQVVEVKKWTHVSFVLNSGTGYLYVNGKQEGTGNLSGVNTVTTGTQLRIGQRVPGGSIPFKGIIDEVRVWDVARTASEITDNYKKELCPNEPNMVAYFNFNNGTAGNPNTSVTKLKDNSKNSNDGTLNNFSLSGNTSNWVEGDTLLTRAPNSDTTFSVSSCGSYRTPLGVREFVSGTIKQTLKNAVGCDSNITINLTIKPTNTEYTSATECDSFRTGKGVLKTDSEIFWETFQNRFGCDSSVQTLLTINKSTETLLPIDYCVEYTTSTGKTFTIPGNYRDTFQASTGCDSVIVYQLNKLDETYGQATVAQCFNFTSPSGKVYSSSGIYVDTMRNIAGCDSIVTLDFTLLQRSDTVIEVSSCDSFRTESGQNLITRSRRFKEFFKNQSLCDSTVNYDVTINFSSDGIGNVDACQSYQTPWGEMVTVTDVYRGVIQNTYGCDSNLTLSVNITKNNPLISEDDNVLSTNLDADSYQWLDCDDSFLRISGANKKEYAPEKSGNLAVEIFKDDCLDTSACFQHISTLNISNLDFNRITVSPNPATSFVSILSEENINRVTILNTRGQLVLEEQYGFDDIDISALSSGIYFIQVHLDKTISNYPLIIANP